MTSRREVLKWMAYTGAGAGAAAAGVLPGCTTNDSSSASTDSGGSKRSGGKSSGRVSDRVLVVIEMGGGNAGLSTVVPVNNGRYHDLRPTIALDGKDIVRWQDGWGLNAALADLGERGLAAVTGVGSSRSDLSHFEMQARWWAGSPRQLPLDRTGFLGRLCDELRGDEELTGISVGQGLSPALTSRRAPTTGLTGNGLGLLQQDEDTSKAMRRMLQMTSKPDDSAPGVRGAAASAGAGLAAMLRIVDMIERLPKASTKYPDTEFARQLSLTSQVIRAGEGVRVLHIPMAGGAFDTHDDHRSMHKQSMELFGTTVEAFLDDLDRHHIDNVLVATTSEFGRRPEEHNGGLDHGTASTMLLMGPVKAGLHGEPSSLSKFDDDGNFIPTVEFDRYLALFAEWLDVDPAKVLGTNGKGRAPQPMRGVLA